MIAVGSCHGDLTESFLQIMMERDSTDLGKTHARYLALALALLYLGKQEAAELTIEALKVIPEPLRAFTTTLLDVCAYAGQFRGGGVGERGRKKEMFWGRGVWYSDCEDTSNIDRKYNVGLA
jgi:hypothetical protein